MIELQVTLISKNFKKTKRHQTFFQNLEIRNMRTNLSLKSLNSKSLDFKRKIKVTNRFWMEMNYLRIKSFKDKFETIGL